MAEPIPLRESMAREIDKCRAEIEAGDEIMPHFVGVDADGKVHYLATPWPNDDAKLVMLRMVRQYFAKHAIQFYWHASEVWLVDRDDHPVDQPLEAAPEFCDDRQEAVIVIGVTRLEVMQASVRITRADGKASVGEIEWVTDADPKLKLSGRLVELLPPLPGLPIGGAAGHA